MVRDNSGWPEAFGFSIAGNSPVVIVSVKENSVARRSGLQCGDQILEVNGDNVEALTKEQLISVARRSSRIPPSLSVISRIRTFQITRQRGSGFGFVVCGSGPVYVQRVMKNSPAANVGIYPGDMLLEVNGRHVKKSNKAEVEKLIDNSGYSIQLKLIAGASAIQRRDERLWKNEHSKQLKAKDFFKQMSYYLTGEEHKKTLLIALMKRYAKDRDIERFSRLVSSLLSTSSQRRLLKPIRYFIPPRHQSIFDVIVGLNSSSTKPRSPRDKKSYPSKTSGTNRASGYGSWSRETSTPLNPELQRRSGTWSKGYAEPFKPKPSSIRSVKIRRATGNSSFGFMISGCNPVFIKSVDKGSPATTAGLRPGDCILELNGLDVRNSPHGTVIELLKNSGTSPTLLVQWRPLPTLDITPPLQRRLDERRDLHDVREEESLIDSAVEVDISPRNGYQYENVPLRDSLRNGYHYETIQPEFRNRNAGSDHKEFARNFREAMNELLTKGEQMVVKQALAFYHKNRDLSQLVDSLETVLDDATKLQMLHAISQLLPDADQAEFDRLAVDMVARQMESK